MTTVYSLPKDIKVPKIDFSNYNHKKCIEDENKFIDELRKKIKPFSKSKYNGKIIRFQVADSYAQYMVISVKPSEVIHLPLGDAWDYEFISRLTGKDISDKIDMQERMNKIFS